MLFNSEFPGGGSRQSECQSVMLVKFRIYWFVERCKLPLFRVVPGDDRKWITGSITTSFLIARLLGSRECSLKRIPFCRFILRYGSFFTNVFLALLVFTFIALVIDLKSTKNYSGHILKKPHRVYFILVIAGLILVLISAVTTGLLAFQRRRNPRDDDFEDSFNRSYSDRGSFHDIN